MKIFFKKVSITALILLILVGCNKFNLRGWRSSFGYNADECELRDRTHHAAYYADGTTPDRGRIWARKFRCRVERVCVGKSEVENEQCKQQARNYWGFDERNEKNWQYFKTFDDSWDAVCTNNPNTSRCSPKWKSQENFKTNPYWNGKSYDVPPVLNK